MTEVRFIRQQLLASVKNIELSPSQLQVTALPYTSVATIIGSPGAGKTSCLVARFRGLIESGISAAEIVVIAATRESANTLRDQLALEYQGATEGPLAKTLTSLAFSILASFAKQRGEPGPVLVSGSEQDQLLKQVLEEQDALLWPKSLDEKARALTGFRTELRDLISVCLEHGIGPDELAELGEDQNLPQWKAAAEAFGRYLSKLGESDQARYDSASLLREAAEAISLLDSFDNFAPDVKVILVDDAQELTPAATALLFQLTRFGAGLNLFGDPDSATLGFRVANPKAMSELAQKVANRASISPETIFLEPAHAVRRPEISLALSKISSQIEVARAGRQRKGLNPPAALISKGDVLSVKVFRSESEELSFIAGSLRKQHLFEGVAWSKMAVVARSRPALEQLALSLSGESVPIRIIGSASSLRDEHASGELLRLARICLIDEQISPELASQILISELTGLDQLGVLRLRRSLRKQAEDIETSSDQLLAESFTNPNMFSLIRSSEARFAEKMARLMISTRELGSEPGTTAESVLWHLVSETKILKRWSELSRGISEVAMQAGRNLDSILSLFAAAVRYAERNPNSKPLDFIQDQLNRDIPEDSLALNDRSQDQVLLVTPAGLIGRRFDTVVLPGLSEGVWPNLKPRSSLLGAHALDALVQGEVAHTSELKRSELTGELRMLNKAVGAASERLVMTATDKQEQQLSQFLPLVHGSYPETETTFYRTHTLRSMVGNLRRELATGGANNANNTEVALGLARLAAAGIPGATPASWYGLLPLSTDEPLTDLPSEKLQIRPSQLDNYLKCPLHWFIETHGGSSGSFSASLGSLIHEVLEVTESSKLEDLEKLTLSRWSSLDFEADWLEDLGKRRAARMLSNLAGYLKQFESSGGKVLAREQNFRFELGNIQVRGQVDRIEQLADGNVVIVDLKTGKPVVSQEETATNPQLALYQMAVLEGGFEKLENLKPEALAGAKLLIVGGSNYAERNQPAMGQSESARFKKLLLDSSEGMSRPVFVAQLSTHCEQERSYGSCSLHLTKAVSYVG
jgi:superfamily I DNA/RNA helicase/RecB family exonuclease